MAVSYFSPLTSPVLREHGDRIGGSSNGPQSSNSPTLADLDVPWRMMDAGGPQIRSSSRKSSFKAGPSRSLRQSPIVKPQKRRSASSTILPSQALSEFIDSNQHQPSALTRQILARPTTGYVPGASTTGSSEEEFVSPEHMSDMAPPPAPRTIRRAGAQESSTKVAPSTPSLIIPATPASLMQLAEAGERPSIEAEEFTEAEKQSLRQVDKSPLSSGRAKTLQGKFSASPSRQAAAKCDNAIQLNSFALPSPTFSRPASTRESPVLAAKSGGGNKGKRASASVSASPALLPRISPSIAPIAASAATGLGTHGGGGGSIAITQDAASILLASKSNYQNMLEGTQVPGVSYPVELSKSLTSKRTSHKLAEQGRRNRMNTALAEMGGLLPASLVGGAGVAPHATEDEGDRPKSRKSSSHAGKDVNAASKASTVEAAIEYIRQLQRELGEAQARAQAAEERLLR
jgi:hypothetical protein